MQKLFFLLSVVLITTASLAQSFEGKIIYSNTYQSKQASTSNLQFTELIGNEFEYYFKGADYKTISNGTLFQWQLYSTSDNKVYSKMTSSEAAFWNDASINPDTVYASVVHPRTMEVLGYMCDELVLTCKTGVQKYYYSSKLSTDPRLFEKHLFGNWYDFVKVSKAIPLKMIIESHLFIMESIAIKVEPMKMDAALFALPAGLRTEKSPF